MSNNTFFILTLCTIFSSCSVVPNSVRQNESYSTSNFKNKIRPEEIKVPSYERSIEFLIPKNITAKIALNNTLGIKKLNDSLKDEVLNEQEAKKNTKIDERSFIFIEQRYKIPIHHRHSVQHPHANNKNYKTFISNHNEDLIDNDEFSDIDPRIIIDDFSPRLEDYKIQPALAPSSYYVNELNSYQPRKSVDKESDKMKTKVQTANEMMRKQYQKATDTLKISKIQTPKSAISQQYHPLNLKHKTNANQENVTEDHHEYVELLKRPLVRGGPNCDTNLTKNNDVDDGVYEDNLVPNLSSKSTRTYSKYGFIRPFEISGNSNNFQEEQDDDSDERFRSDDVIAALHSTDEKSIERILKEPIEGNVMDGKPSTKQLLTQLCKNHSQRMNPQCKCAKADKISSKPNEGKNEESAPVTASDKYVMTSPLRLIRGPESDDIKNSTVSTEKNSRQ